MLADSDTEEEEPEKENSTHTSVEKSKENNGGPTTCIETPLCTNGVSEPAERSGVRRELVLSPVKSVSPAAMSSSPLLKTPPKRQTGILVALYCTLIISGRAHGYHNFCSMC